MEEVCRRANRRQSLLALIIALLLVAPATLAQAHDDDHDGDHDHEDEDDEDGPLSHLLDDPITKGLVPPTGFVNTPWAAVPSPTNLAWGPDDRLYVLSAAGLITAFEPVPGDVTGVGLPFYELSPGSTTNGLALDPDEEGVIYVSEWYSDDDKTWGRVWTVADTTGDGRGDTKELMVDRLPGGQHWVNDLEVHPEDGMLYITNGNRTDNGIDCSSGDTCHPEDLPWSGALLRVERDARDLVPGDEGLEVVTTGLRNLYDVAFWPPDPSVAYIPENGPQDPAGDDVLHRTNVHDGHVDHHGFPSCLIGTHERHEFVDELVSAITGDQDGHHDHGHSLEPEQSPNGEVIDEFGPCDPDEVPWPVATFGGHVSANGAEFAHGSGFAGTYGNDLYVALWGSLEASSVTAGHKIARVNFRDDGSIVTAEDGMPWVQEFATGGLPLDLTFGPDGAMYVADMAGTIQRIAWTGAVTPPNDEGDHGHAHDDHGDHGDDEDACPPDEDGDRPGKGRGNGQGAVKAAARAAVKAAARAVARAAPTARTTTATTTGRWTPTAMPPRIILPMTTTSVRVASTT